MFLVSLTHLDRPAWRSGPAAFQSRSMVEISESSAAQVIALSELLDVDPERINPHGGAIARGHPLGAAGAVLVARLFSSMVRMPNGVTPRYGVAALGAIGGLGRAALFETVP